MLFSPGIYEHAAALVGEKPWKVSRDPDLLHRAQLAAWNLYHHPMLVAGIDVYNVEPEALGAGLDQPSGDGVPSVVSHPATSVGDLLQIHPLDPAKAGRMPLVLEAARRLVADCPGTTVYVPLCGPIAFANGLVGMDEMLCTLMEEPELAGRALHHLAGVQEPFIRAIVAAGARPLIFESGASPPLLPPALFSQWEAPALGRLFSLCGEAGDSSPSCILGGNILPSLPALLALNPGFLICPSETDQSGFVDLATPHPDIAVRVNMPVAPLLTADWESTAAAADRATALARRLPRGSVGTGVVPYNTSPELLLRLRDHIQQTQPTHP